MWTHLSTCNESMLGGRAKTHIMEPRDLCRDKDRSGGKKTSDSESTQLNALIIVPLHFL